VTVIVVGVFAAMIGLVALTAVVLGMLWLIQFVLRNEERRTRGG
jgi:hypothetical protein